MSMHIFYFCEVQMKIPIIKIEWVFNLEDWADKEKWKSERQLNVNWNFGTPIVLKDFYGLEFCTQETIFIPLVIWFNIGRFYLIVLQNSAEN